MMAANQEDRKMRIEAGQAADSLWALVSVAAAAAGGLQQTALAGGAGNGTVFLYAAVAGFVAALLSGALAKSEKYLTALGVFAMALFLGPIIGEIIIYRVGIRMAMELPAIAAASFGVGLFGWPLYRFFRAVMVGIADNPGNVGAGIVQAIVGLIKRKG